MSDFELRNIMKIARDSLRTQQKEFTRARFLGAAQQIFMERGYVDVTVEDIADGAGASRATFYAYFHSKTDLAIALLEEVETRALASYSDLDEIMAGPEDMRVQRLQEWLKRALRSWKKWRKYSLAMWQAAALEPEIEKRVVKSSQTYLLAMKATMGKINPKDRERVGERIMMVELMTERLFYLAAHHDMPINDETLLEFMAEIWLSQFRTVS